MAHLDVLDTIDQRLKFKEFLEGKRLLHVKGFGGTFKDPNEDQIATEEAQEKGAVAAMSKFNPDYLVVDGDPWDKGFQRYIKAFVDARRQTGDHVPQLIWAKNLPVDTSNQGRPKSEEERTKRYNQANEWLTQVGIPVTVFWIDNDHIATMVDKVFGAGTWEKLKPEKFNKRGAVRIVNEKPQSWVNTTNPEMKKAIQVIESRQENQCIEKCSFENAAKGHVIYEVLHSHDLAAHGTVSFGGGESVLLEFATFYLNSGAGFDQRQAALYPYSRGRDSDPKLPKHAGADFVLHDRPGHTAWVMKNREILWPKLEEAIELNTKSKKLPSDLQKKNSEIAAELNKMEPEELFYFKRGWVPGLGYTIENEKGIYGGKPHDVNEFPGYSVMFPMTRHIWGRMIAGWFLGSALKLFSLVASITLCFEIQAATVPAYTKQGNIAKCTVFVIAIAYFVEICRSWHQTWNGVKKRIIGMMQHNFFGAIGDFFCEFFLRWFEAQHDILAASEDVFRMNIVKNELETKPIPPVRFVFSENQYFYNQVTGKRNVWINLILNDIIGCIFKGLLFFAITYGSRSPSLNFAFVTSVITLLKSLLGCYKYVLVITSFYAELTSHMQKIGLQMDKECFDLQNMRKGLPLKWITETDEFYATRWWIEKKVCEPTVKALKRWCQHSRSAQARELREGYYAPLLDRTWV